MALSKEHKFLLSSALGTFLEFLDFTLYASASSIIAARFFPNDHPQINIICTWGIFAVSFLARPFGAIVFGYIGDIFGGRKALLLSMVIMSFCTILIGLLPDYSVIGLWAPFILMLLRILQGLSVSPEFNATATYLSFNPCKKNFGLKCSTTNAASSLGLITGGFWMSKAIEGYAISNLPNWRWRLPFIISGTVLGLAGLLLRSSMSEGKSLAKDRFPLLNIIQTQKKATGLAVVLSAYVGFTYYTIFAYTASYLQLYRQYSIHHALQTVCYATFVAIIISLLAGRWSDRVGAFKVLRVASLAMALSALAASFCMAYGTHLQIIFGIGLLASCEGAFSAVIPAYFTSLFKEGQRYSGSSFAYGLGISIAGGIAPLSMTILSKRSPLMIGYVLSLVGIGMVLFLELVKRSHTARAYVSVPLSWPAHS